MSDVGKLCHVSAGALAHAASGELVIKGSGIVGDIVVSIAFVRRQVENSGVIFLLGVSFAGVWASFHERSVARASATYEIKTRAEGHGEMSRPPIAAELVIVVAQNGNPYAAVIRREIPDARVGVTSLTLTVSAAGLLEGAA